MDEEEPEKERELGSITLFGLEAAHPRQPRSGEPMKVSIGELLRAPRAPRRKPTVVHNKFSCLAIMEEQEDEAKDKKTKKKLKQRTFDQEVMDDILDGACR